MDMEKSVAFAVKALSNQFHRYMTVIRDTVAIKYPEVAAITDVHGRIIEYLYDNLGKQPIYQKDVEKEFVIRRSTATIILQRMEKAGLVRRIVSQDDARLKEIVLTERARKIHPAARAAIIRAEKQATRGLTNEEIETFLRVARKIAENIE